MRIAIGCDHRGLSTKRAVASFLTEQGHEAKDFGTFSEASVDYPDIARVVAEAVASGECQHGILICSTGVGMSMAANKVPGIRAALCTDAFTARRAREHNDANVLCLGESVVGPALIEEIVSAYIAASFEGGRHTTRIRKIADIERGSHQASPSVQGTK